MQRNQHEFKHAAEMVEENLQNYRMMVQPIADVLAEVGSADFADQEKLTK